MGLRNRKEYSTLEQKKEWLRTHYPDLVSNYVAQLPLAARAARRAGLYGPDTSVTSIQESFRRILELPPLPVRSVYLETRTNLATEQREVKVVCKKCREPFWTVWERPRRTFCSSCSAAAERTPYETALR